MKHWRLAALGLALYVAGIVAMAPATLIDASVQGISSGKLRLVEVQGSVWSGAGQIEMRDPGGRVGMTKSLAWRIRPQSLWRGHLAFDVQLEHSGKAFPLDLSLSGIELASADIRLPATALGLGVPRLAPLGLTGEVLLHIASLSLARKQLEGKASLQWRDAGSRLTPISPLGDYELNFDGDGATVTVLLRTLQGSLQLDGKGSWAVGAHPEFIAVARVPSQHQAQLGPLLRLIAVERGTGSFELQFK